MEVRAWKLFGAAALLAVGLAGCAVDAESGGEVDDVEDTSEAARRRVQTPYYMLRRDTRRCVSPLCGGVWVRAVNQTSTRCADGSTASECYVADVDWSGLGLDDTTRETFSNLAASGQALVRGRLRMNDYGIATLGQLVATEGWRAVTDAEPSGSFYQVTDNGVRCITTPCFSLNRLRINTTSTGTLSEVVLNSTPGATDADIDSGHEGLHGSTEGILVAGVIRSVSGGGRRLRSTQFYLRVGRVVPDSLYCDADSQCTSTVYHSAPTSTDDCYCRTCPTTVLNTSTAESNESEYNRVCSRTRMTCPLVRCVQPPPVACQNHVCERVVAP